MGTETNRVAPTSDDSYVLSENYISHLNPASQYNSKGDIALQIQGDISEGGATKNKSLLKEGEKITTRKLEEHIIDMENPMANTNTSIGDQQLTCRKKTKAEEGALKRGSELDGRAISSPNEFRKSKDSDGPDDDQDGHNEDNLLAAERSDPHLGSEITWHTDASSRASFVVSPRPSIVAEGSDMVFKPTANKQKTLLFDCGNVLFYHSRFGMATEMGLGSMICYLLTNFTSPRRVFDLAFEVMFMLGRQEEESLERPYVTHQGDPLPGIMYEWLAGLKTNSEIVQEIHEKIEHLGNYEDFFRGKMEKDLTMRAIETIFTPATNVRNVHCLSKGLEIAKRSKAAGHQNIILSNWDSESFELVKKKFPILFDQYIDHICISGDVKMNKPHECIYRHVVKEYNLNPADCIFIDDQEDNINAGKRTGIYGIQCLNHNEVIKELEQLNII
eukprot:Nk52_evm106s226 gene=Nk52_evmTU106s226